MTMHNQKTFNSILNQAHEADVYTYPMDDHIHTMIYDKNNNLLAEAWEGTLDTKDIYQIY